MALEAKSERIGGIRREFYKREIIEMTGETPVHSQLITSINALVWFKLRGTGFSVFSTDLRLYIPAFEQYVYPDGLHQPHHNPVTHLHYFILGIAQ